MNQGLVVAAAYATLATFLTVLVIVVLSRKPFDPEESSRSTDQPGTAPVTPHDLRRVDGPSDPVHQEAHEQYLK